MVSDTGYAMAGATAGELGGYLTLGSRRPTAPFLPRASARPPTSRPCSRSPRASRSRSTTGELCSHFIDGTPSLNAYFGAKQVSYTGTHKRARVTNGSIGFQHTFIGAQGQVGLCPLVIASGGLGPPVRLEENPWCTTSTAPR